MSWRRFATVVVGTALALAPAADARSGGGIYEPFPEATSKDAGVRAVNRLIDEQLAKTGHVTAADLERGVVLADAQGPPATAAAAPSSRAVADGLDAADVLLLVAALGLAIGAARLARV